MKTCTKCGKTKPLTNFGKWSSSKDGLKPSCKECRKQEYQQNKEHVLKKRKERYKENKETHLEYCKIYRETNKKKIKELQKDYYLRNSDKIKSRVHDYYHENKDKLEVDRKLYRDKWNHSEHGKTLKRMYQKQRNELKKNLISSFCEKDWNEALNHFDNRCAYCGERTNLQEDHVIPVTKGGHYIKNNIVPSCQPCNNKKWAHDLNTWYPKQLFFENSRYEKLKEWILQ